MKNNDDEAAHLAAEEIRPSSSSVQQNQIHSSSGDHPTLDNQEVMIRLAWRQLELKQK